MHHAHMKHATYTGRHAHAHHPHGGHPHGPHHPDPHHGFCHSCCHPVAQCCCSYRECRKESKELLVKPTLGRDTLKSDALKREMYERVSHMARKPEGRAEAISSMDDEIAAPSPSHVSAVSASKVQVGLGTAFIGGGCCVHLSIEYTPSTPTVTGVVAVLVDDSEGTILAWAKQVQPGEGYQVKEGIITTKPGADLTVVVRDLTARVRWCEIFSC